MWSPHVGQAVVEGVVDEVAVTAEAASQGHELGDARVRRPRQPPGQQLPPVVAFDPKDLAQLLFEQVRPVEGLVGGRDFGEAGALLAGQVGRVLAGRPHRVPIADPCLGHGARPHLVQRLERPGDDMKGIQANHRLRRAPANQGVDPVRAVTGHVGKQLRPLGAELVEEPAQGVLVAALGGPHQPARPVINHDSQIAMSLAIGNLVDADPGQPRQQVVGVAAVGDHPGHDRRHGAPGDAQKHREHAQRRVRGQPRAGVLEQPGVAGARPRPWHVRHHHPMLRAFHPRHRSL